MGQAWLVVNHPVLCVSRNSGGPRSRVQMKGDNNSIKTLLVSNVTRDRLYGAVSHLISTAIATTAINEIWPPLVPNRIPYTHTPMLIYAYIHDPWPYNIISGKYFGRGRATSSFVRTSKHPQFSYIYIYIGIKYITIQYNWSGTSKPEILSGDHII